MCAVEKTLDDKVVEEGQARGAVKLPETTRLRQVQAEPRHLFVLTANTNQESIVGHD